MVRGPKQLLELTPEDKKAIDELSQAIDSSTEFRAYDGYEIKVKLPREVLEKHLNVRKSIRMKALQEKLNASGWAYAWFNGSEFHLAEHTPRSSGDPRD